MAKKRTFHCNYNRFLIIFISFLVLLQIPESYIDIISKVFAISPQTVRQEIIDDENDWQPWEIKIEENSEQISNDEKNSLSNSKEIKSDKCKDLSPTQLPDIQSLSYMSDGDQLNVTLWLTQIFSEVLYEDILKNETFSVGSDISSDTDSLSLSSSSQPRIVKFVMAIDIVSVLNRGIDYIVELSSPTKSDNPVWTKNIYEISAFGNKKLVYPESFDTFPYNDKNFVEFSIDLKSIGNPDKYKLLLYIVDIYTVEDKYCRIVDTSNWSLIPTPEFSIVPTTSNIVMRPPEEKGIIVNINTNSELESKGLIGVNYTNDNDEKKGKEKKVNINFVSNNITITPYTNNSATLNMVALEDEQLKNEKQIPIKIFANISFPQTITNRGGDTYYNNKTISMLEYSDLTLTLLPPLTFTEQLENFTKSLQPIGELWGVFTTIGLGISGFIAFIYKRMKDKQGKIPEAVGDGKRVKKDDSISERKRSPI